MNLIINMNAKKSKNIPLILPTIKFEQTENGNEKYFWGKS